MKRSISAFPHEVDYVINCQTTPEGLLIFTGNSKHQCFVYLFQDELTFKTMIQTTGEEHTLIRTAILRDDQTIILSSDNGQITRYEYKELPEVREPVTYVPDEEDMDVEEERPRKAKRGFKPF